MFTILYVLVLLVLIAYMVLVNLPLKWFVDHQLSMWIIVQIICLSVIVMHLSLINFSQLPYLLHVTILVTLVLNALIFGIGMGYDAKWAYSIWWTLPSILGTVILGVQWFRDYQEIEERGSARDLQRACDKFLKEVKYMNLPLDLGYLFLSEVIKVIQGTGNEELLDVYYTRIKHRNKWKIYNMKSIQYVYEHATNSYPDNDLYPADLSQCSGDFLIKLHQILNTVKQSTDDFNQIFSEKLKLLPECPKVDFSFMESSPVYTELKIFLDYANQLARLEPITNRTYMSKISEQKGKLKRLRLEFIRKLGDHLTKEQVNEIKEIVEQIDNNSTTIQALNWNNKPITPEEEFYERSYRCALFKLAKKLKESGLGNEDAGGEGGGEELE